MGRFVVFEGGEGSGKSTQARLLAQRWNAVFTFEPGGTAVGQQLRQLLLDPETGDLDARGEALLMAADRAHHVATVIRPALMRGRDVVCDRYVGSSLAYQGHARGLGFSEVQVINDFATEGLAPDLVVLLSVPEDVAAARLALAGKPDRMESAGVEFHRKVAEGYAMLAAHNPHSWVAIDGTGLIEEVEQRVKAIVESRFPSEVAQ